MGSGATGRAIGVLGSLASSAMFAALFFLAEHLRVLNADLFSAWRVSATVPVVAVLLIVTGRWREVREILERIRGNAALLPVLVLDGLLLGMQIWTFTWAPQHGQGLSVALGYLLLPLVMVLVGLIYEQERLSPLRAAAVVAAVPGVLAALVIAGGLSPATAVVALGYPVYFTLRRRARLDSSGAFALELIVLLPIAAWTLIREGGVPALAADLRLVPWVLLLGGISGVALLLFLNSSRLLTFGLFGLLTYVEPILLIVVSVALLHERVSMSDLLVYGPISLALLLLGAEPFVQNARRREAPGSGEPVQAVEP